MRRRDFLKNVCAGTFAISAPPQIAFAMTPGEIKSKIDEYQREALAKFPLKLIETTGDQALSKWQELKSSGQGTPVVLGGAGDSNSLGNLLTPFGPNGPNFPPLRSPEEILKAAEHIKFPDALAKKRKADSQNALAWFKSELAANPNMRLPNIIERTDGKTRTYTREETIAAMETEPHDPPLGEWPVTPDASAGLSVAYDITKGTPLSKVYIGIAPTDDWTAIPAILHWGGWNDCPAAEYHVAAMRLWRDRYGAELIGMSSDTLNLRVAHKPKSREEALALAHDQYVYYADIIDQGVQTYSALAAALMANDWWYFWWD